MQWFFAACAFLVTILSLAVSNSNGKHKNSALNVYDLSALPFSRWFSSLFFGSLFHRQSNLNLHFAFSFTVAHFYLFSLYFRVVLFAFTSLLQMVFHLTIGKPLRFN